MAVTLILVTGIMAQANPNVSCDREHLIGRWRYYKFIYDDHENPPLSPNLIMEYEFFPNGTNRLHWVRTGENAFCERRGMFIYKDCHLLDVVTWVNHKENTRECGSDPDMQINRQTISPMDIRNGDLYLHLQLSGKPFHYVWKRIEE